MNSDNSLYMDLIECCRRVYSKGYVASNDGNLSIRLPSKDILASPAGKSKGFLTTDELVVVDRTGQRVLGRERVTTEIQMHLAIYEERPDVGAVVHAHPVHATGFATANVELKDCVLAEIVTTLGSIPLAPYATPSTKELPDSIRPLIRRADAILLANHGVVTCGKDIYDAYFKMERVEHYAQILFVARCLGGERKLTTAEVEKLEKIRQTYGTANSMNPGCVACGGECLGPDCSIYEKRNADSAMSTTLLVSNVIEGLHRR